MCLVTSSHGIRNLIELQAHRECAPDNPAASSTFAHPSSERASIIVINIGLDLFAAAAAASASASLLAAANSFSRNQSPLLPCLPPFAIDLQPE